MLISEGRIRSWMLSLNRMKETDMNIGLKTVFKEKWMVSACSCSNKPKWWWRLINEEEIDKPGNRKGTRVFYKQCHMIWVLQTLEFLSAVRMGSNRFRGVHIFCKFWELRTEPEVQFWMVQVQTMVLNWTSPSLPIICGATSLSGTDRIGHTQKKDVTHKKGERHMRMKM